MSKSWKYSTQTNFSTLKNNDDGVFHKSSKHTDFKKIIDEKKERWRKELISNFWCLISRWARAENEEKRWDFPASVL